VISKSEVDTAGKGELGGGNKGILYVSVSLKVSPLPTPKSKRAFGVKERGLCQEDLFFANLVEKASMWDACHLAQN